MTPFLTQHYMFLMMPEGGQLICFSRDILRNIFKKLCENNQTKLLVTKLTISVDFPNVHSLAENILFVTFVCLSSNPTHTERDRCSNARPYNGGKEG